MLLTTKLTVVSQVISTDSLKCFTYEQARQIITDLQQLPIKDSIIKKLDSIIYVDSCVIEIQAEKIENQTTELIDKLGPNLYLPCYYINILPKNMCHCADLMDY